MIRGIASSFAAVATCLALVSAAHGQGQNQIFQNPNPDRTWTAKVGGVFSSAKSCLGITTQQPSRIDEYNRLILVFM